tara:strand:+ start:2812 stop:3681 length:870 start_codon:yes stop_codon:yes gene_type:complete
MLKNLEYFEIKSIKDLKDAILFLEKGFKWDRIKSSLLEKRLPELNKDLNTFGIMMKADEDIVGAMLFFHQGYKNIGNKKKTIINLSGWYIHEEFRGLPTMSFLKFMVKKFDKYILTNYSAKPIAEKIYTAIGFKKMKLKRASLLLPECILNFSNIKIRDINKDSLKVDEHIEACLHEGVGIRFLEFDLDSQKVQLIVKKRLLIRSLFGFKFNWRTTSIIWSSNEAIISKHWRKISNKLLFHTKSLKLVCDFSSYFPNKAKEKVNNYMFLLNDDSLDYVWPIQSEMNIFD